MIVSGNALMVNNNSIPFVFTECNDISDVVVIDNNVAWTSNGQRYTCKFVLAGDTINYMPTEDAN